MSGNPDLSLVDIRFLQTVKDINNNPEKYTQTDRGELPANTASIKRATDLTDQQISYRMGGNSNSKGFESGDDPLIISHRGKPTETGYEPRSVELTSAGVSALLNAQRIGSKLDGITQDEFEEVKSELETLKKEVRIRSALADTEFRVTNQTDDPEEILTVRHPQSSSYRILWNLSDGVVMSTYNADNDKIAESDPSKHLEPDGLAERVIRSFDV